MHLKDFECVAGRILRDQILDLRVSEGYISLTQQSGNVAAGDLGERVFPVLKLPEALGSQAKLGLARR